MAKPEDQIINLMDLLKIPEEKRNFKELRNRIQNLIKENDNFTAQIQSTNGNSQSMTEISPLETILNTPGLVHLAENIFNNLDYEVVKVCRDINQSSQQILDKPMFWLRKFRQLSKKNHEDWIKFIQSMNNSEMKKAIIWLKLQGKLPSNCVPKSTFKGPSTCDVTSILEIFDPPPP